MISVDIVLSIVIQVFCVFRVLTFSATLSCAIVLLSETSSESLSIFFVKFIHALAKSFELSLAWSTVFLNACILVNMLLFTNWVVRRVLPAKLLTIFAYDSIILRGDIHQPFPKKP